jgi:hypothetical protein
MANVILNYYTASFDADANGIFSVDTEAIQNQITKIGYELVKEYPHWQTTFNGKTLSVIVPVRIPTPSTFVNIS